LIRWYECSAIIVSALFISTVVPIVYTPRARVRVGVRVRVRVRVKIRVKVYIPRLDNGVLSVI
jgi:hypothetical protein